MIVNGRRVRYCQVCGRWFDWTGVTGYVCICLPGRRCPCHCGGEEVTDPRIERDRELLADGW